MPLSFRPHPFQIVVTLRPHMPMVFTVLWYTEERGYMKAEYLSSDFTSISSLSQLDDALFALFCYHKILIVDTPVVGNSKYHWAVPSRYFGKLPTHFPKYGYKLHISIGLDQVFQVFNSVIPLLLDEKVYFKCACSGSMIAMLNAGFLGLTQVGKCITVYPSSFELFKSLCSVLSKRTTGFVGPVVPSDYSVPNSKCLYYRYGEFISSTQPDSRLPGGAIPAGVNDPFPEMNHHIPPAKKDKIQLIANRFFIFDVLRQRGKGGVYKAYDFDQRGSKDERPFPVVLKEGRRYGERDLNGRDAQDRLKQQAYVLQKLKASPYFAQCFAFVEGEQRSFLSMTYFAEYKSLGTRIRSGERPKKSRIMCMLNQVVKALDQLHEEGFTWNDLSSDNILIDDQWNNVRISDVEEASCCNDLRIPQVCTPGFSIASDVPIEAWKQDVYALHQLQQYLGNLDKFAECLESGDFGAFDTQGKW